MKINQMYYKYTVHGSYGEEAGTQQKSFLKRWGWLMKVWVKFHVALTMGISLAVFVWGEKNMAQNLEMALLIFVVKNKYNQNN